MSLTKPTTAGLLHHSAVLEPTLDALQLQVAGLESSVAALNSGGVVLEAYGGKGDNSTDNADAFDAALAVLVARGGGILRLREGIYKTSRPVNLKGKSVSIWGSGMLSTTILPSVIMAAVIDLDETADARLSPVMIRDLTVNANGVAAQAVKLRFRHYTNFTNVLFTGGGTAGFQSKDAWLNTFFNCGFESSNFGLYLEGANHRTAFYSCSFQGNTSRNIVVRKNATANDGNTALYFANCDVEFADGLGIDFEGSDATFDGCYLGENLKNSVFQIYSGHVRIRGGVGFFGFTTGTKFVFFSGTAGTPATLSVEGMTFNGQTAAGFANLVDGSNGKASFEDCPFYFPTGGGYVLNGDLLREKGGKRNFAPKLGIEYSSFVQNATVTETTAGDSKTITAATVPGPSPIIGLGAPLLSNKWKTGGKWALVVVYSSNVDFTARVEDAALGAGTAIGSLPATGGAVKTAVLYMTDAVRTNSTRFSVYRDTTVSVGHTITLHSVSLGDDSAAGTELSSSGSNLFKF